MKKLPGTEADITNRFQADADLCERVVAGDPDAGQEFYDKYHRLAEYFGRAAVSECRRGVVDFDDLTQSALVRMLTEAKRYDPDREVPFGSFVSIYMGPQLHMIIDDQYDVRAPQNIRNMMRKIHAINAYRLSNNLPMMSDEDIATECGIPVGPPNDTTVTVGAIRQAMLLTSYMGSIDNGFNPHGDSSPQNEYVLDSITALKPINGEAAPTPDEEVTKSLLRDDIRKLIDTLAEREKGVICMRFGIDDGEPKTLEAIATAFGVSRERIRQIERDALAKLRHPSRANVVKDYLS